MTHNRTQKYSDTFHVRTYLPADGIALCGELYMEGRCYRAELISDQPPYGGDVCGLCDLHIVLTDIPSSRKANAYMISSNYLCNTSLWPGNVSCRELRRQLARRMGRADDNGDYLAWRLQDEQT